MIDLETLDRQIDASALGNSLPQSKRASLASTMYAEIQAIGETAHNQLRNEIAIAPETYLEELAAFQAWMDLAHSNRANPASAGGDAALHRVRVAT